MGNSRVDGMLGPLVALVLLVAVAGLVRLLWSRLLVRRRAPALLGRWLAQSTATPVFLLILAVGTQLILTQLPGLRVSPSLNAAAYLLIVASGTWVAYGLVKGVAAWYLSRIAPQGPGKPDAELVLLFRRVAQVLLLFTALTVILEHYNFKLTALLGVAGVASLAAALAAQDTLANMIAGFTIMLDRPFRLGDRVELSGGRLGDVYEIGLRSSRLLAPDHTVHIIPNAELAKSSIVNHSYPDERISIRQKLTIAYGNDLGQVKQMVVGICRAHPGVLAEPEPRALVTELGEQAVQVMFAFWIADHRQKGPVLDEIQSAIYERFARGEIRAPTPQMEVHLKHPPAPGGSG